jgi:transposase
MRQLVAQIDFMETQLAALDEQIAVYYSEFPCNLHTIPGIGPVLTAVILSEIGDVSRFSAPQNWWRLQGLILQSGNPVSFPAAKVGCPNEALPICAGDVVGCLFSFFT